ncbi:hypothetical protein H0H87_010578 [Tephrocybe sp. NHM501043]|nr:hypothetical protein H0H87_010578 [Tephrocybe sp. NHM501043]
MSTRQALDSNVLRPASAVTSRKRSSSEADGDTQNSRSLKKSKRDDSGAQPDKKKKKNRRRSRKRKSTVTQADHEPRTRSRSRSATVGTDDDAQIQADADELITKNLLEMPAQNASEVEDDEDTSNRIPYADKGKGKAGQEPIPPVIEAPEAQIARLQQQLEAQRLLLKQHQTYLTQVHQALSCQICLDLLYKPFALAPCGHVVCYPCLVRWFTAPEAAGGPNSLEEEILGAPGTSHQHKKKKCPICRTHVMERPVEVWGVKDMVAGLTRSGLVELLVPTSEAEAEASTSTNEDPWQNIFHRPNRRTFYDFFEPRQPRPPREGGDALGLDEVGMYDEEDGGIYRCVDCMHEIARGECTHCHRLYPGHQSDDDDDDDNSELDFGAPADIFRMLGHAARHRQFDLRVNSDSGDSVGSMFDDDDDALDDVDNDEFDGEDGMFPDLLRRQYYVRRGPILPHFPALPALPAPDTYDLDNLGADIVHLNDGLEPGIAHIDEVAGGDESGEGSDRYESDFIDDADLESAPPSSDMPRISSRINWRRAPRAVAETSDDVDDEIVVLEESTRSSRGASTSRRRMSRRGNASSTVVVRDDDEDEDEEDLNYPRLRLRALGRRTRIVAEDSEDESDHLSEEVEDDDDDERTYEDDGSRSGPSSRLLRMMQHENINFDDDSESDA